MISSRACPRHFSFNKMAAADCNKSQRQIFSLKKSCIGSIFYSPLNWNGWLPFPWNLTLPQNLYSLPRSVFPPLPSYQHLVQPSNLARSGLFQHNLKLNYYFIINQSHSQKWHDSYFPWQTPSALHNDSLLPSLQGLQTVGILNIAQSFSNCFPSLAILFHKSSKGCSTNRWCTIILSIQLFLSMRYGWFTFDLVPYWTASEIGIHFIQFCLEWEESRKDDSAAVNTSSWSKGERRFQLSLPFRLANILS